MHGKYGDLIKMCYRIRAHFFVLFLPLKKTVKKGFLETHNIKDF